MGQSHAAHAAQKERKKERKITPIPSQMHYNTARSVDTRCRDVGEVGCRWFATMAADGCR
jgi:hypothetical protein